MTDYRALLGLTAAFLAACVIAAMRPPHTAGRRLKWAGLVTLSLQAAHFAEELATGFYIRFPALFGFDPWTREFFIAFNAGALLIWLAAIAAVGKAPRLAGAALWFLALSAIGNGLAHPLAAMISGGYFPGLLTAPFLAAAGLILSQRLWRAGSRA